MANIPRRRCACVLLVCSSWLGCALDFSGKSACRTDRDCNRGRVCSMSRCVAPEDVFDASSVRTDGESDGEPPAASDDDAEPPAGGDNDGGRGGASEPPEQNSDEPDACALDATSAICRAAAPCADPDFDRLEGVCTRHDDCAGVDACAPGECVDGSRSFACKCPSGFMTQGQACLPAAQCAAFGCSQRCVSGLAKPTCSCDGELVLASDDKTCKAGAWSEPLVLTETGGALGSVALAVSRTGPAMLLFQERVADVLELKACSFHENAWEEEYRLESEAYEGNIAVAIDDFGRSTAIFERIDPTGRHQHWTSYSHRIWSTTELLDGSISGFEQPSIEEGLEGLKIAASGRGDVYAIWRHAREVPQLGTTRPLYVQQLSNETAGKVARRLAPDVAWTVWGPNDLDIAVEEGGIATAVWTPLASGTETPLAQIDSFHDRAWTGPGPVDLGNTDAPALRASLAPSGRTTHIVWISDGGVYRRELAPDGTPTELVAPLAGAPGFVTSAAAAQSLIALWTEVVGGTAQLRASIKLADRAWSGPDTLHSAAGLLAPSLRVVSDGSAVAFWFQLQATGFSMHMSRYSPTTETWSAPTQLTPEGASILTGTLGMDEGHRVMVAWSEAKAGGGSRVLVRRFE